jgi:hypothetical protein
MSPLLDPSFISSDKDYKYACDNAEARQFVETQWERYREFADKKFAQEILSNFHNHFWEMFLACTLKDLGNELIPKKTDEGPDIDIKWADSHIWIEATAAGPGEAADRILLPTTNDEMGFRVPEEQIVLRYTNMLEKKYKKYLSYKEKGIIAKTEPYIIAVNGNKVPYAWDDEVPYIIQAVLPIGLPTIWVNWEKPEESASGYAHRPQIQKLSGSGVSTDIFLRKEYEGISGVLFSRVSIHEFHIGMGEDFIFAHNPQALNKVPEGWLRVGHEYRYRIDENALEGRRWSR